MDMILAEASGTPILDFLYFHTDLELWGLGNLES